MFMQTVAQTTQDYIKMTQTLTQNVHVNTQSIKNIETQLVQLTNMFNERERGTFPSQPIANPNNTNQVQDIIQHQVNQITTLWSGKQIDNRISMPVDLETSTSTSHPSPSPPIQIIEKEVENPNE